MERRQYEPKDKCEHASAKNDKRVAHQVSCSEAATLSANRHFVVIPPYSNKTSEHDNVRDDPVAASKLNIKTDMKCDLGPSHCYVALPWLTRTLWTRADQHFREWDRFRPVRSCLVHCPTNSRTPVWVQYDKITRWKLVATVEI